MTIKFKTLFACFIVLIILFNVGCTTTNRTTISQTSTVVSSSTTTLPAITLPNDPAMQNIILTVGNNSITTGYFLERVLSNPNGDVASTLQLVISEIIINQEAASIGITPVTTQDIDTYLRNEAQGTNATITDAEYNQWFNEQLANTGLSATDYRQVAAYDIQRQRLTTILSADIPSSMQQYHVYGMYFNSYAAAVAAKADINSLADFNTIANTDGGQTNGGDLGWMPLAVLSVSLESAAKNLDVGTCSDPITYQSGSSLDGNLSTTYWLLWLSDESDSMTVTPSQLAALQGNSMDNWLNTKTQNINITLHDRNGTVVNANTGTFDEDTLGWLNNQVQLLRNELSN